MRRWVVRVGAIGLVVLAVAAPKAAADTERGWSFLVEKLVQDGVPRERALAVFRDARVPPFDGLYFSLEPREPQSLYRQLRTAQSAARARQCLELHRPLFAAAERRYGVPGAVVASIIQVESGCGRNTGRARILPGLARLAMAAEPENLARNVERHTLLNRPRGPGNAASFARWRAEYLEDLFYPEVLATFEVARRLQVDPLEIRGSGSGAFGMPQFLPRSYLWYGVDGDGDGHVSLWHAVDAIPSCANYLQQYGWRADLTRAEQRNVIWGYNRSDAYIDTVLWLAGEVDAPSIAPAARPAQARRRPAARSTRTTPRRSPVRKATPAKASSTKPPTRKATTRKPATKPPTSKPTTTTSAKKPATAKPSAANKKPPAKTP